MLDWPAAEYRAAEIFVRDYPPMATAGPRVVAEGFGTVLQSLVSSKQEIPPWAVSPSLWTRPVAAEAAKRETENLSEGYGALPGL